MTTDNPFNRIHALCTRLRDKRCEQCPAREFTRGYGFGTRGCYALAQEAANIARFGNPWGKRAKPKNVRSWRKRALREYTHE